MNLHLTGDFHAITSAHNLLSAVWPTAFRATGFDMTVASEVMSILSLAKDLEDLQQRLGSIVVAYRRDKTPIHCRDIKVDGVMTVLLKDGRDRFDVDGYPGRIRVGPVFASGFACRIFPPSAKRDGDDFGLYLDSNYHV
jgi:formyltetrahydrofolate synthetase